MNREDLDRILRTGNAAAVRKFFAGMSEKERSGYAPFAQDWHDLLILNSRADWDEKAKLKLEERERIKHWRSLLPIAVLAGLATYSLTRIETLSLHWFSPEQLEDVVTVFRERRPPWLDQFSERFCEMNLPRWGGEASWRLVRRLVCEDLIPPPRHDHYVLGALHGIWPQTERGKPAPKLTDLLQNERDWLESDFWRLFEIEGYGDVSLAHSEKYGGRDWAAALLELAEAGVLSRDRLLDATLAALSRDFVQFRAGWYSRFHEQLKPTVAERKARRDTYVQILGSSIPPTVAFALNAIDILDHESPLAAKVLIPALEPALLARSKATVSSSLKIMERLAGRDPSAREAVCLGAMAGLLQENADVQKRVFDLLDKLGDPQSEALRTRLESYVQAVVPSQRSRLARWTPVEACAVSEERVAEVSITVHGPVSRIDPTRAVIPIQGFDDLLQFAASVLEEPGDPMNVERLMEGLVRLSADRPNDFDKQTAPLRRRAHKKFESTGRSRVYPLDRMIGVLILAWIEGDVAEDAWDLSPKLLGEFEFLRQRMANVADQIVSRCTLPLLSAPTHLGGWIDPEALVRRSLTWREAKREPDLFDQVLALLRLAPENRADALKAIKTLKGEFAEALKLALGGKAKTGPNQALWLAAWRSRCPSGDLPEFEAIHPKLGPDGGTAAVYSWAAERDERVYEGRTYYNLVLGTSIKPEWKKTSASGPCLPVLFHTPWRLGGNYASLLAGTGILWPANAEATFAQCLEALTMTVNYSDVADRELYVLVKRLGDPHCELRPMACLALALALAAHENGLRGFASDALIAAITEGRLDSVALGSVMSRLLETGFNPLCRWARGLREVARVSIGHAKAVGVLLINTLQGDSSNAPKDVGILLELLFELVSQTGVKLHDSTRKYLASIKTGGKTGRLARQLLEGG